MNENDVREDGDDGNHDDKGDSDYDGNDDDRMVINFIEMIGERRY